MAKRSHPPDGGDKRRTQQSGDDLRLRIVRAVEAYWRQNDRSLTIREVCALVGLKSTGHVAHHVDALVAQERLRRLPGSRGLLPARTTGVPFLGTIAAGFPIDVFDEGTTDVLEVDELTKALPHSGPPARGDIYALQVQGDFMVEDGILDGDFVLIAFGPTVAQGAIAVAVHDSANGGRGETTLKRVYVHEYEVHLKPANPAYPVRVISREEWDQEWKVQGAVVGSYRHYAH
jgi:repressor LexA